VTDERRLRELFESARRRDEASAPRFLEVLRRERPTERAVRIPLAARFAAIAIVLALIGLLAVSRRVARPTAVPPVTGELLSSARWSGPTDFLLTTPGRDLLRSTPRIGVPMPFDSVSSESRKGIRT
jgi:hypothetical protein